MTLQNLHLTQLIIVAHEPLASALQSVVMHVHGKRVEHVHAIDVRPNESAEHVALRVSALLGKDPSLVLSDLLGATPHNGAALAILSAPQVPIIHSVSAYLLLRALNYSYLSPQSLYEKLTQG